MLEKNKLSYCIGGLSETMWGDKQFHQQDRVYKMCDIALCLPANIPGGSYRYLVKNVINSNMEKQSNSK